MKKFFSLIFLGIFLFMIGLHLAGQREAMSQSHSMPTNETVDMPRAPELAEGEHTGDPATGALKAIAVISGTQAESTIDGWVSFMQTPAGLQIEAKVLNVPNPGDHGFHIHEKGSCGNAGADAGGHYNPDAVAHGLLTKDGHTAAHAGDMGNMVIDENGDGVYKGFLPLASLSGDKYNVLGLAVILHEKADDFGQPTGNAGGRIGCGIITAAE